MTRFLKIDGLYPEGKKYFKDVVLPSMLRGEERWPSWDCLSLLSGYNLLVEGEENIAKGKPVIWAMNHWRAGPLRAWWQFYAASTWSSGVNGQDVRWIIQDSLEAAVGNVRLGMELPLFSQMQRLFSDTYHLVIVPAPFKKAEKGSGASVKIADVFARGESLGITPELGAGTSLARGNQKAGYLIEALARSIPEGCIQPCAAYSKGDDLVLNFGKEKKLRGLAGLDYQVVADDVMLEVANLLPENLRGFYK